jgi:hypothetical protein
MWFVAALLVAQSVALPPNTPIPCLVCKPSSAEPLTFSGTVQYAESGRLRVFNGKTHQSMGFVIPSGFHAVASSDGKIKDAPLAEARPGLLVRVTYRTRGERREVTGVLLLTLAQCRSLMAAEALSKTPSDCPD